MSTLVGRPAPISICRRAPVLLCLLSLLAAPRLFPAAAAQQSQPSSHAAPPPASSGAPSHGAWGDQGDGTYSNPILPADVSDLDAIRVGDRFLAITSTFQYSPGMAVLESRDLVNWHILSHVVPDLTRISPALNWDRMDRPGRGIWAGSLRFHAGRYWVYFGTPDEGLFLSTAPDPTGPWTPVTRILPEPGWDDPCPFWDDDGSAYLVTTRYAPDPATGTPYNIHLFRMNAAGGALLPGSDRVIHHSKGSEANKLYKIHGLYFHLYSEVAREGRVVMMERSSSLTGPWETRQLIHVHAPVDKEPNQGGLIELPSGQWFFLTHQGTGDWEGRAGALLPVTWIENWPILGRPGSDGIGHMVWHAPKPIPGSPLLSLAATDTFTAPILRPEWEWNYQPRPSMWSLTEHPGTLRLHAFPPLAPEGSRSPGPPDFRTIGNILTQRSMRTPHNEVTVQVDLTGMADGQQAGLVHYAKTFAALTVLQTGTTRSLTLRTPTGTQPGPTLTQPAVWLRSTWNFAGLSHFLYSLDGATFTTIGSPYQLTWGDYRGDRIGLFTTGPTGYADFTSFRYQVAR